MLSLSAISLAQPARVSADTDPTLAPVLIGNWQYFYSGTVMGTIRFDGLTAGTIYDNRYGTGNFTGKFAARNVFKGKAMMKGKEVNIKVEFYHPQNDKATWTFKGWVFDYSNGSFDKGKKL